MEYPQPGYFYAVVLACVWRRGGGGEGGKAVFGGLCEVFENLEGMEKEDMSVWESLIFAPSLVQSCTHLRKWLTFPLR